VLPAGGAYTAAIRAVNYHPMEEPLDFTDHATYTEVRRDFLLKKDEQLPGLSASVVADVLRSDFSLMHAGTDHAGLTIEYVLTTDYLPLLNYVFFDEATAEIPQRYHRMRKEDIPAFESGSKNWSSLPTGTIERYWYLLDLVGLTMKTNPGLNIELTGTTDGTEQGGTALATRRAEAVRGYLTSTWDVPASRIAVKARELPAAPSSTTLPQGREENRRVEISSPTSPNFPRPLEYSFLDSLVKPDRVVFSPSVQAAAGVDRWMFRVWKDGDTVFTHSSAGSPPETITWDWRNGMGTLPAKGEYVFSLTARDRTGQTIATDPQIIPIKVVLLRQSPGENSPDHVLERISLILFDFDRSSLDDRNIRNLKALAPKLSPTSTVRIRGFTDELGEEAHNQVLSEKRAAAARDLLQSLNPGVQMRSEGVGESALLYRNDLPEGRFYCRTVQILIETRK
jgi:outer membrane protein OmpA-like peptidoglycan-associated protein